LTRTLEAYADIAHLSTAKKQKQKTETGGSTTKELSKSYRIATWLRWAMRFMHPGAVREWELNPAAG
jgi:hypothetical protein